MPAPAPEGDPLGALEERIGHRFGDRSLLREALTHPSVQATAHQPVRHNQRLEFVGDAVLHLTVARLLFQAFPEAREGDLTGHRSILCGGRFLSALGEELGLGDHLILGPVQAEERATGRPRALEDALEAVAGAIFLDAGFEAAAGCVAAWIGPLGPRLGAGSAGEGNPKGRLQERVQPLLGNEAIRYTLEGTQGPPHRPRFIAAVWIAGAEAGRGEGPSKRAAEEEAARAALRTWSPPGESGSAIPLS